jgi:Domain of unknown function (DUF4253)
MSFSMQDLEAYGFGLAVMLVIYAVVFYGLPLLLSRAQKKLEPVAAVVVQALKPRFPFPSVQCEGQAAMAVWERARNNGERGTVLFGGGTEGLAKLAHGMSFRKETPAQILQRAANAADPYPFKSQPKHPAQWPVVGPFDKERNPFSIHLYPEGFRPVVSLVTTPAKDDADILAHLKFGGWNACPPPEVHVAMLRKWQRDYGAELVAFSEDILDIRITRKPATQMEALKLAREHQKYCPTPGLTIAERAAELMLLDWWHLWWD